MSELESLSVHEKLARHLERHALDRLVMLCDGVFAIATTLAAVEVHLPDHAASLGDIWAQAGDRILTYVISFFVIATFWLHNRDLFARASAGRQSRHSIHAIDPLRSGANSGFESHLP